MMTPNVRRNKSQCDSAGRGLSFLAPSPGNRLLFQSVDRHFSAM